jgi:hypothetical protein
MTEAHVQVGLRDAQMSHWASKTEKREDFTARNYVLYVADVDGSS